MSPKFTHILHRLGEILGFTLMDTETGHRMMRQLYRVGEFDDHTPDNTPPHEPR